MSFIVALTKIVVSSISSVIIFVFGCIISLCFVISAAFADTVTEYEYGDDYVSININNVLSFTLCNGEWKDYVTWEINLGGKVDQWSPEENISVRSFAENGLFGNYQMIFDRGHYHDQKVYGTFTKEEFITLLSWLNNSSGVDTNIALYGDFHREHVYLPRIENPRKVFNEIITIVHNYGNFNL